MVLHRSLALGLGITLLAACSSASDGAPSASVDDTTVDTRVETSPPATIDTTAPPDPTTTTPSAAVQRWADDLQVLADGVRDMHPNPFWRQPEDEFDASLAAAPERLADMSDADARAEVMRLTSQIDGHTGVYLGEAGFHLYDIHLYDFDGELAVIAAGDPTLIGATVLRIGSMSAADAAAAVAPYSSYDNAATVRLVVPTLLTTPEVLHAAGVVDDVAAPQYVVRLTDGTERTVDPAQLTWAEFLTNDPRPIGMTKNATIPALARIDEPYWTTELPTGPDGGQTLYFQYNEVVSTSDATTIDQLADEIDTALRSTTFTRLVVDLRYNTGGNDRTYTHLLDVLATNPTLARPGALVVLIGRQTFSAGALFATEVGQRTSAVFVGEDTGGSPNLYANPRPLTLPNSGIIVNVSTKYYDNGGPDDRRDAVNPDMPVPATLADFLAERDPVLDVAVALP